MAARKGGMHCRATRSGREKWFASDKVRGSALEHGMEFGKRPHSAARARGLAGAAQCHVRPQWPPPAFCRPSSRM